MILSKNALDLVYTSYNEAFAKGLVTPTYHPEQNVLDLVSEFPSATAVNCYAWIDRFPRFRKWIGDRVFNSLKGKRFLVPNEDYEDSVRVERNDFDDNQYGQFTTNVQAMAAGWPELRREDGVNVFLENRKGFDEKPYFATDHVYGENHIIANLVTTALSAAAFDAAFITAAAWQFADGTYCKTRFTHLLVGEGLRSTAEQIVKAQLINDGNDVQVSNTRANRVELRVLPELQGDYANHWFLVDAGKAFKPIGQQIRKVPKPLMDTDPATLERTGYVDYMASGRMASMPTFPHLVYCGTGAG